MKDRKKAEQVGHRPYMRGCQRCFRIHHHHDIHWYVVLWPENKVLSQKGGEVHEHEAGEKRLSGQPCVVPSSSE
eukprot:scaffold61206_cov31-Attheya_sp.AAC.1